MPERFPTDVAQRGEREFEVVVLGASGLTGRLAARCLAETPAGDQPVRWAVAGRTRSKLQGVLDGLGVGGVGVIEADTTDATSLTALARRTAVVASFVGPYTSSGPAVVEACIAAGTAYVDLSGELPLLHRINERYDSDARRARTQVVQMAGWEALPADVLTLLACRRAIAGDDATSPGPGDDGPGAGAPIADVQVTVSFSRSPEGGVSLRESVSSGTLASIIEQLEDPESRIVGDPAGLLPASGSAEATRKATHAPAARLRDGRVLGPAVPVAFLDPPVIHRTAALLAERDGRDHDPARLREGVDEGSARDLLTGFRFALATGKAISHRSLVGIARLPGPVRHAIASTLHPAVTHLDAGPTGHHLEDWEWTVRVDAETENGKRGSASLDGRGHPGYTATAAMIIRLALHLARADPDELHCGCITPALAFGVAGATAIDSDRLELH